LKQVNVRLSQTALDHLATLRAHYGLSQTALFEFLLREHARQFAEKMITRRGPLTESVSPAVTDEEAYELDGQRFRGLRVAITRAELDRP
jgi:hypothetical protein